MRPHHKFTPDGTKSVFVDPSAFLPDQSPVGLAFDRFGNLFVSTEGGLVPTPDDAILKFTPGGMKSTFAPGLSLPRGLAFDSSGNLFVTEHLRAPDGDILKFAPDGTHTVFASGLGRPEFLTFGPPR
jgi:sugar lactone lactonase YvrE